MSEPTQQADNTTPKKVDKFAHGAGIAVGGKVPKGMSYIRRLVRTFKRHLDEAVIGSGRDIDIATASQINQACHWHRHLKTMEKLLADTPDLTPGEILSTSREIAKAAAERDRSIRALGLIVASPPGDDDPWLTLAGDCEPVALPMLGDDEAGDNEVEQDEAGSFSIEPADTDAADADEPHTGEGG